jgi:hypothetical protein
MEGYCTRASWHPGCSRAMAASAGSCVCLLPLFQHTAFKQILQLPLMVKKQKQKENTRRYDLDTGRYYGNPDCQAPQGFAKHVAAANAGFCCWTKAQGRCKRPHTSTTSITSPTLISPRDKKSQEDVSSVVFLLGKFFFSFSFHFHFLNSLF